MGSAKKKKNDNILESIFCGLEGLIYAIKKERHIQIGLFFTLVLIIMGFVFQITLVEWMISLLCVLIVLALELVNTALEVTVDIAMPNIHPLAKIAKDVMAGSVVLSLLISSIIGLIIFLPRIIALF